MCKINQPSVKTIKKLFAVSGNACAFTDCNQKLSLENGDIIGEICHIKGKKQGSPRYDKNQSDEERHSTNNLILLCPTHHKIIDKDPETYPVERIRNMKLNHEMKHFGGTEPSDDIAIKLLYVDLEKQLEEFRQKIIQNIPSKTALIIHLIPNDAFNDKKRYDLDPITKDKSFLKPIKWHTLDSRYDSDGFISYHVPTTTENFQSYVKVFRSGLIEAVDEILLSPFDGKIEISRTGLEKHIIKSTSHYLDSLEKIGADLPIHILITLKGVKGYGMSREPYIVGIELKKNYILKANLELPIVIIEEYKTKLDRKLREGFDMLWNSCDFPYCPNYDENGNWTPKGHFS